MESQPQNPELRINPENFHPCILHNNNPYHARYFTVLLYPITGAPAPISSHRNF